MMKLWRSESIQDNPCKWKSYVHSKWHDELEICNFDASTYTNCEDEITTGDLDQIDQQFLLVGTVQGSIQIYDLHKLMLRKPCLITDTSNNDTLPAVECVQLHPLDNGMFTSTYAMSVLDVWDPNVMQKVESFELHSRITNHHISPVAANHTLVANSTEKGSILMCDLRIANQVMQLKGHKHRANVVKWNPLNQYHVTSGGSDGTIRFWDTRSSKSCYHVIQEATQQFKSNSVGSILYNKSGTRLICLRKCGTVQVYNTVSYKCLVAEDKVSYRFSHPSNCLAVNPLPKDEYLYVPHEDTIRVYNCTTGSIVTTLDVHLDPVHGFIYDASRSVLYSFAKDCNFFIWIPQAFKFNDKITNEYPQFFKKNWEVCYL